MTTQEVALRIYSRQQEYGLPFMLLSDPEMGTMRAYDVFEEGTRFGKPATVLVRTTYLIDGEGVIVRLQLDETQGHRQAGAWRDVGPLRRRAVVEPLPPAMQAAFRLPC